MNSVLQSLSNIQKFSDYFNTMPSLETGKHKQKAYQSRSMKENLDDVFVVEELRKVRFVVFTKFHEANVFCASRFF